MDSFPLSLSPKEFNSILFKNCSFSETFITESRYYKNKYK